MCLSLGIQAPNRPSSQRPGPATLPDEFCSGGGSERTFYRGGNRRMGARRGKRVNTAGCGTPSSVCTLGGPLPWPIWA